jgi:hypothetical protein
VVRGVEQVISIVASLGARFSREAECAKAHSVRTNSEAVDDFTRSP